MCGTLGVDGTYPDLTLTTRHASRRDVLTRDFLGLLRLRSHVFVSSPKLRKAPRDWEILEATLLCGVQGQAWGSWLQFVHGQIAQTC